MSPFSFEALSAYPHWKWNTGWDEAMEYRKQQIAPCHAEKVFFVPLAVGRGQGEGSWKRAYDMSLPSCVEVGPVAPLGRTAAMLCCVWYSMKVTPGTLMFKYQNQRCSTGCFCLIPPLRPPRETLNTVYVCSSQLSDFEEKVMRFSSHAVPAPELNKSYNRQPVPTWFWWQ